MHSPYEVNTGKNIDQKDGRNCAFLLEKRLVGTVETTIIFYDYNSKRIYVGTKRIEL